MKPVTLFLMKKTISALFAFALTVSLTILSVAGCEEKIEPPATVPVTGVSLNKTTLSLVEGASEALTATVAPDNATNKSVSWKTSDAGVATVDNNGTVAAVKPGTATITVTTADGGKTATCAVTVTAKKVDVTGVTLDKTTLSLDVGGTEVLTATVAPDNATDKSVSWKSSDAAVASVDGAGKVTAVKPGTATITVTTTDGAKTATCEVTVKEVAVEGVSVEPATLEIKEGQTYQLKAVVTPAAAVQDVEWAVQNSAIATVDDNGLVTAVKPGTTRVTARSKAYTDKQGVCEITVKQDDALKGISLDATELSLQVGGSRTLTVIYNPEYAANKNVTWESSDSEVAFVTDGKVTALKEGSATITATSEEGGFTAKCEVTVSKVEGPFLYYFDYGTIYVNGMPDPMDGAFDKEGFKYYGTERIFVSDNTLYSLEWYNGYKNLWICKNRKPLYEVTATDLFSSRNDINGFSARNGVYAILSDKTQFDFTVIRATEEGDVKAFTVNTPANHLLNMTIAVAPDGTVHVAAYMRDTFFEYCVYWYSIAPDGTVTEKLIEKDFGQIPQVVVSDGGDAYIFGEARTGGVDVGRLYKNGELFMDIDEVEYNFQGAIFCAGDHIYTAISDYVKKELRLHKDGQHFLTIENPNGAFMGNSTTSHRLFVAGNGDVYLSWCDNNDVYYLTKNGKVIYTSNVDSFHDVFVIE